MGKCADCGEQISTGATRCRSCAAKKQWEDPEFRAMRSERMRQQWEDPEYRARISEKVSEKAKKQWEDPEYRAIQSELSRQLWEDPEYRENLTGENHYNWHGGTSFEPYGLEFNDTLKQQIRKRDNHTCAIGDEWGNEVHHINYCKADNLPENLITLCHSCHSKTNFNRNHWESFLSPLTIERNKGGAT